MNRRFSHNLQKLGTMFFRRRCGSPTPIFRECMSALPKLPSQRPCWLQIWGHRWRCSKHMKPLSSLGPLGRAALEASNPTKKTSCDLLSPVAAHYRCWWWRPCSTIEGIGWGGLADDTRQVCQVGTPSAECCRKSKFSPWGNSGLM
jgi:hypothetical protein